MNIDKLKDQHEHIHRCISTLRTSVTAGIEANAGEIARLIVSMSSVIKLHLAVEDRFLYPALHGSASLAQMGQAYQSEMQEIAASYEGFARRWNLPAAIAGSPEGFRADANIVLKRLYQRICREDRDFYPAIEAGV